jgi:hypothetical protein
MTIAQKVIAERLMALQPPQKDGKTATKVNRL